MGKIMKTLLLVFVFLLLLAISVSAADPDQIITNSQDWRDVYSTLLYASATDRNANFLVSDRHSRLILNSVNSDSHLWIINSKSQPYVTGFADSALRQGFSVEEFTYKNVNLELASLLDRKKYILIDDSYGYNAISVAPYAVVSDSFVLFADRDNINEVTDLLADKGATDVLIYGHVDREVRAAVAGYNPEIINLDGDRFANNIEIVKKYQEIASSKQAILTNGEFVESALVSGKEPVIFIGTNNVPDVVREYISNSDIKIGVLIGNELVNTATFVRRQIGISVFVKFARSARSPSSSISQVEALDMFYMPSYDLDLAIESVTYNRASSELEVTFENRVEQGIYAKSSYTITNADGSLQTVGDVDSVFIEGNEFKTFVYSINPLSLEGASVDAFVIYGESKNSLEKVIEGLYCSDCEKKLELVDILDKCDLNVSQVSYEIRKKLFRIGASNPSGVSCFVDMQIVDVIIAAERQTLALEDSTLLGPGSFKNLRIKADLDDEDIADNPFVNIKAFYGQRENRLINVKDERFPLLLGTAFLGSMGIVSLALITVILLAVALFTWKFYKKGKKPVSFTDP